mmetsp:Transcript_36414/g.41521  ORF Transcript_36414/g.41521 Transcript_36414/m.41521 type:complete len:221 (-) Transcript_36414:48-710(-)
MTKSTSEYIKDMFTNHAYIFTLLGNLTFYFAMGALNMFTEELLVENFQVPKEDAWITTGLMFLIAGLAGPLLGAIILDYQTTSLTDNEGIPVSNIAVGVAKYGAIGGFVCGACGVWCGNYSVAVSLLALCGMSAMCCLVCVPIGLINIVPTAVKHWSVAFAYAGCSLFQAAVALWLVRFVGDIHGLDVGFTLGLGGFLASGVLWNFAYAKEEPQTDAETQ